MSKIERIQKQIEMIKGVDETLVTVTDPREGLMIVQIIYDTEEE